MTRSEDGPRGRRRLGKRATLLTIVAVLAALGLFGWAITRSIDRSDDAEDTSERAIATAVSTWDRTGGDEISALLAKAKILAADVQRENLGAIGEDANALQSAVTAADTQPLVPDSTCNNQWETALAEYSSAAQSAWAVTSGSDQQVLSNMFNEVSAGDADLSALSQRIQTLTK